MSRSCNLTIAVERNLVSTGWSTMLMISSLIYMGFMGIGQAAVANAVVAPSDDPILEKVQEMKVQEQQLAEALRISETTFLHNVFNSNLQPKILEQNRQSRRWALHADYGDYDYTFGIQGTLADDPTTKAMTANAYDIQSNGFNTYVSKKSRYGISSKVFLDKNTSKYRTSPFLGNAKVKDNTAELGIGVSIELLKNFLGKMDQANLEILEYNKQLNELQYKDALESFFVNASISYYQWILAKKSLEINNNVLANANRLLESTINKRKKRGIIDNKTLLSQQANVTSIKGQVINLERSVKTLAQELRFLTDYSMEIGEYDDADLKLSRTEQNLIHDIAGNSDQIQLDELTQVKLTKIAAEVSNKALESAQSDKLPSLSLDAQVTSGSYGNDDQGGDLGDAATFQDDPAYQFSLNFSYPIMNTRGNSKYQSAKYEQISNQLNYTLTQKQVMSAVQNSRIQISKMYENYLNAETHLSNEKAKYNNEIKEYNLGRSDIVDLINFQNSYLNAEDSYYSSILNLKIAIRSYLYLTNRMGILYADLAMDAGNSQNLSLDKTAQITEKTKVETKAVQE